MISGLKKLETLLLNHILKNAEQLVEKSKLYSHRYPTADKAIEKLPEKDPELGQGEDNPGVSCIDIL